MTSCHIPSTGNCYTENIKNNGSEQQSSTYTQLTSKSSTKEEIHSVLNSIIHGQKVLGERVRDNLTKTAKCDKYIRLCCNVVKILRLKNAEEKKRYSKLYREMLVLRQVFRWNGLYETIQELLEAGTASIKLQEIGMTSFKLFTLFGDILDRAIFFIEILKKQEYTPLLNRIEKLQSDCYFIECFIWLFYHLFTFSTQQQGKKRKIKGAKILKYIIDCITSHNKFSRRVFEIDAKYTAYLGVISSLIGLYTILI